jgi:hypothetical protein
MAREKAMISQSRPVTVIRIQAHERLPLRA